MSYKNADSVSFEGFVAQYMGSGPDPFAFQASGIKLYPLSIASTFITPPTPLFRAEYNFLLLFLAGGGKQQVDNEIVELKANDVLFIREGHLNAIKSIDPDTDGYYIYIDNTVLAQIFTDSALLHRLTFYPKHSVSRREMEWLCNCCELLVSHKAANTQPDNIGYTLLRAIVLKLAEASPAALARPDRPSAINMLFKELLYDNFLVKREVKFYADSLAVSENYLNRCVRTITSKPPKQHINEMVINQSKVLLQDYSKDIAQVAFELNFSEPSYFGRLFKQLTRQTPTEYRNSLGSFPTN
ncbi:helix-turn-helix domain-containing protein [Hymenobacter sp. IS2118]|uniref:helix-turn-helix domain-containing protein n=1 Tax=Hymenobacter sp. IS2118 TaxID=1505605 RepID=UPI0009E073CF|nr:helix-turn-helix domain-containing protein [Hymenobacter sp. IS2118]